MDSTSGIFERKEKLTLLSIGCVLEILLIENIAFDFWPFPTLGILSIIVFIIGFASNISALQRLMYARNYHKSREG